MTMLMPQHALSIRPIAEEETEAVLEVYRQCEDFLALGPVSTASLEMSRAQAGVFCGIYAADGKMVGIVDYVPKNWEGDPSVAFLSLLMIGAPFRGQGIGATVVEAVENEIRKDAGINAIASGVQVNNPQAIEFWQRHGYRIVSGPIRMPDQTTVFHLRKDLISES